MASQQLAYAIKAVDEATATMKKIQASMDDLDKAGDRAAKGGLTGSGNALKSMGEIAGGIAGAQVLQQIPGMLNGMATAAAGLELQQRKSNIVFGEQIGIVQDWAGANAAAMGLTRNEATAAAASMADLLIPMGFARQEAAEMSTEILDLSGALAEWSNGTKTSAEVADILTGALLGETDQLKSLGISISAADIQARILEKSQQDLTGAARAQAEALVIQELVMEKSVDAQAAYADGADSAARKQSEMTAKMNEAKEALNTGLGPAIADVTALGMSALIPMLEGVGWAAENTPASTMGIAAGFLAMAAAAPKAAELGGGVVRMIQDINEKGLTGAQRLTGIGLGIGAITIAADLLLTKTTGYGLWDYMLGDVGRLKAHVEAAKDIENALYGITDPAERNVVAIDKLGAAARDLAAAWESVNKEAPSGADTEQTEALENYSRVSLEAEESARALGEEMIRNGATVTELARAWHALPGPLRETFNAATDVEGKLAAMHESMPGMSSDAREVSDAFAEIPSNVEPAGESIQTWGEKVAGAAADAKAMNDVLDDMNAKWLESNPAVQALDFSIATLDVAIANLSASGDELTESQTAQLEGLKAQKEGLEAQRETYEAAAGAIETYGGRMSALMGTLDTGAGAWETFRAAMDDAGVTQQDQLTHTQNLSAAYDVLATGDLPAALGAFENLKLSLAPDVWATIAQAVGPQFIATVADGVASPDQVAKINGMFGQTAQGAVQTFGTELASGADPAVGGFSSQVTSSALAQGPGIRTTFAGLGDDAASGFEAGILARAASAAQAAYDMVMGAIGAAKTAQRSQSPSLEYMLLGENAGEGYAEGLEASEALIADASAQMVGAGVNAAAGMTGRYTIPIFGLAGGGGDWNYIDPGPSGENAPIFDPNAPGQFTGRGLQAPGPARQSVMGGFWAGLGMTPTSMTNDPFRMNAFDFFTTREDWAQMGYGADSEWTSDPWFGFVPKEFLRTAKGAEYLELRGIDPLNNSAVRDDYNPYHPNAMTDGGTRVNQGGKWTTAYRRVSADTTPKGARPMRGGFGGGGGGGVVVAEPDASFSVASAGPVYNITINAVDAKSVAQLAAEHPEVIVAATDTYRSDRLVMR